jgi:hypothetical protein
MVAKPGRPRQFDSLVRDELLHHVGHGATVVQAARIVGTSLRTVQREAKLNDEFHHDLELAVENAPVNPLRLMGQAARAHWRAAAWMLERTDPDQFGKRPPHCCSVENLQGIMTQLIEIALEATPAEQHEAVYRRMRSLADKALDVLTPDRQEGSRWIQSLSTQPTPLSDRTRRQGEPASHDTRVSEATARQNTPCAESLPPNGGILSPKMQVTSRSALPGDATAEPPATESDATEFEAVAAIAPSAPPKRLSAREAKSLHIQEHAEARRARRQAARAKRKARKAA